MSSYRVTQRSITTTTMRGLQANQMRMQQLQEQLSSGRQVNRPSDSPVKTVEAMQFRGTLSRTGAVRPQRRRRHRRWGGRLA
jgi:flagellar hook-associated protein 3 FlgL